MYCSSPAPRKLCITCLETLAGKWEITCLQVVASWVPCPLRRLRLSSWLRQATLFIAPSKSCLEVGEVLAPFYLCLCTRGTNFLL